MKLLPPIFGGFAVFMAVLAFISHFTNAGQDNRGTTVGYFVGTAVVFAVVAFISTFFNKQSPANNTTQVKLNTGVRKVSLTIVVSVFLFISILYLLAWWL
jgi:Na+/melibiose symporter-like transporter